MKIFKASVLYFLSVFGAGFLLGCIRVPLLVPRLGVRTAELLEMPIMFIVIFYSAHWIVRRFQLMPTFSVRFGVGGIALGLLLLVEFSLVLWLQGISVAQYLAGRDPVSGSVYVAMLVLFAAMPLLVRSNSNSSSV